MLLVGPSPVFMSYVERVLPSLGEDTAELRSLGEIVDGVCGRPARPAGAGRAQGLAADAPVPAAGGAARRRRVRPRSCGSCTAAQVLRLRAATLAAVRRELHGRVQHPNAGRAEARRALVQALWADRPEASGWIGEGVRRGARRPATSSRGSCSAWWPMLAPVEVLGWLADGERVRRRRPGLALPAREVDALAASWRGAGRPVGGRHRAAGRAAGAARRAAPAGRAASASRTRASTSPATTSANCPRRPSATTSAPERPPGRTTTTGTRTSWSTRRRTSRRCSGGCSAGAAGRRAGPSSATPRRARGRTRTRPAGAAEALRGKQIRRFHLGTNYRNSAEIFEFAAAGGAAGGAGRGPARPRSAAPASAPGAGRSPRPNSGGGAVAAEDAAGRAWTGTVGVITPAARRARWPAGSTVDAGGCRWSTACGPRAWSTTGCSWSRRTRSRPSRRPGSGCSTSRSPGRPSA